jgi:hypothetical protein
VADAFSVASAVLVAVTVAVDPEVALVGAV